MFTHLISSYNPVPDPCSRLMVPVGEIADRNAIDTAKVAVPPFMGTDGLPGTLRSAKALRTEEKTLRHGDVVRHRNGSVDYLRDPEISMSYSAEMADASRKICADSIGVVELSKGKYVGWAHSIDSRWDVIEVLGNVAGGQ